MRVYSVRLTDTRGNKVVQELLYDNRDKAIKVFNNSLKYHVEQYPMSIGYYEEQVGDLEELEKLRNNFPICFYELWSTKDGLNYIN